VEHDLNKKREKYRFNYISILTFQQAMNNSINFSNVQQALLSMEIYVYYLRQAEFKRLLLLMLDILPATLAHGIISQSFGHELGCPETPPPTIADT